jgi:NarL family two-component system response regulator YdfI
MIRVLIVASYASVRAGLHAMLVGEKDVEIVSSANGSAEVLGLIERANPSVIVVDDDPADRRALFNVSAVNGRPIVLLTDDRESMLELSSAGLPGWACLLKEADTCELYAAVVSATAGLITLDSSLLPLLTDSADRTTTRIYGELPDPMSARELEVLQLLAQGLPNKVIANRLNISQHTVKFHVAGILSKLNAGSRTEAVTLGARRGLVTI